VNETRYHKYAKHELIAKKLQYDLFKRNENDKNSRCCKETGLPTLEISRNRKFRFRSKE
jgi:hypothetical protein